ncbi:LysR family transcriptional regulator [Phenylobacterium sp.]|uniref:LysR family transcriptional regulator n=1 Tax=Phenylobacterium sp. TaxID=1871053 RepID=UPI0025D66975|nr:LysR family transcriptional regulator [Phenylobacterium sp.]
MQQLKHLIAAVECGNLLRAADECNISQSGLSRSIGALEDRLGVQLLLRKPKGVEPTVFGLAVLPHARIVMNELARCADEIRSIQAGEVGEVNFGVTQNYSYYFIPQILADLNTSYPGIRISVKSGGYLDLIADLKVGSIDFVFGLLGQIDDDPDIVIERLREHHSRVVARTSHPLAQRQGEIMPEQLAAARWATLTSEGFQRSFIGYFFSRGLNAPVQVVKTDSMPLIQQSIASTDLLAVLPPDVALREIDSGELVFLDCEAPAEQTDIGIVTRQLGFATRHRNDLLARIRKHFGH